MCQAVHYNTNKNNQESFGKTGERMESKKIMEIDEKNFNLFVSNHDCIIRGRFCIPMDWRK